MPSVYMAARQVVKKRTTLQGLPSSSSPSSRRPSQQLSFPATVLPAGVLPNRRPSQQLSFEALLPAAVLPSKRPSQQPSLSAAIFPAAVIPSSRPCHSPLSTNCWQPDQLGLNVSTGDLYSNLPKALEGSLASDDIEKEEVRMGRWGLPERMGNTDLAFSLLEERAVVVSRISDGWMLMCAVAGVNIDEVFRPLSGVSPRL